METREEQMNNDKNADTPKLEGQTEETVYASAPETETENAAGAAEAKIAELNDKYLRLYSEFDNFRKRTSRERADLIKTAGEDIFKSLLPVLDDFERALKAISDDSTAGSIKEGVSLIQNKLKKILVQRGLEEMNAQGTSFDPDLHEALTNVDAEEGMKGKVVDEVEKGYLLNGKVIRHAKVVVGK